MVEIQFGEGFISLQAESANAGVAMGHYKPLKYTWGQIFKRSTPAPTGESNKEFPHLFLQGNGDSAQSCSTKSRDAMFASLCFPKKPGPGKSKAQSRPSLTRSDS